MDPKVIRANHREKMKKLSGSFYDAASRGDVTLLHHLKNIGAEFCKIGPKKMNPLHVASMNGHYDVVKILIDAGVDINEVTKDGKTALHVAVVHGRIKIVKLLLSSGALKESSDKLGMTPLLCACKHNNTQLVNILQQQQNIHLDNGNPKPSESDLRENISSLVGDCSPNGVKSGDEIFCHLTLDELLLKDTGEIFSLHGDISNIPITESLHSKLDNENESETYTKESFTSYQEYVSSHAEEDKINDEKQNDILQQLDELEKEDITIESLELDEEDTEMLSDLMSIQATLMSKEDASLMLLRLIGQGRTMELTEAGRRAFEMVTPNWMFKSKEKNEEENEDAKKTETNKTSSALVLHRSNKTSTSSVDYLQELSHKLNKFGPTFKCRPRLDSSPPLKRCRV